MGTQSGRALGQAIKRAGGVMAFVKALNAHRKNRGAKDRYSRYQIYRYTRAGKLPAELVLIVEEISGISRTRLRGDIYPSKP